MKKRLEAELISIAHRILKLKNKSELDQLHKETQKLYETLSVLKFYQDNFESVKDEVSEAVLEEKLEQPNVVELAVEPAAEVNETEPADVTNEDVVEAVAEADKEVEEGQPEIEETEEDSSDSKQAKPTEPEPANEEVEQPEVAAALADGQEEEVDPSLEEEQALEEKPAFEPIFGLEAEEEEEEQIIPAEVASEYKAEEKLEDMIGNYADPVFVKPDEVSLFPTEAKHEEEPKKEEPSPIQASVNEALSKSIAIGLNDRIGFVQHLFNGSNEDFNRVISQLNTFDTFEEAKTFINEMVIPDYNYWVGEEEYIERFMEIVEKKFQ